MSNPNAGPAKARLNTELDRVAHGDAEALRKVYDLSAAKLLGICMRIVQDRALAEDVLQEVYLKVWRGAVTFDASRASPMTWMGTLARNTAIDWLRAAGRREQALGALREASTAGGTTVWSGDADLRDSGEELHRCMEGLDTEQRASIRSAFFDGFTYAELAERVRVPLGTMKSWIRRGLISLRECIENG